MKNHSFPLLITFFSLFALSLFAQKGLQPKEVPFVLPIFEHFVSVEKNHRISIICYEGKPKNLDFADLFYFNPWERVQFVNDLDGRMKRRLRTFYSWRFLFNEFHLRNVTWKKPQPKEDLIHFGVLTTDIINDTIYQNIDISLEEFNPYFRPFYFKKTEVTNKEYKAFITYVQDSIAHTYSDHFREQEGNQSLAWDFKIDWNDEVLESMFYTLDGKKHIKKELLVYHYSDEDGNTIDIPIYPDTSKWGGDFPYSYNEPMSRNYFAHPAFDFYPVNGVNHHQAKAFCHWKTKQIRATLPPSLAQKIEAALPRDYEWEWIATEVCERCPSDKHLLDDSWVTDLQLTSKLKKDILKPYRSNADHYPGNFGVDGALYTHQANLNTKELKKQYKKNKDKPQCCPQLINLDFNGISSMGDNVSEWMEESYSDWSFSFNRQMQWLEELNTPDADLARQIALHYDKQCDKDGYLVRGGNWFDERFSTIKGKNKAGIQAKTFLAPYKSHSTVGFRYVIRFIKM